MKVCALCVVLLATAALTGCGTTTSDSDDVAEVVEPICNTPGCADSCTTVCTAMTSCGFSCTGRTGVETTCGQAGAPCGEHTDSDGDGLVNFSDNCPFKANRDQRDCDGDGIGDVCDSLNARYGPFNAPGNVCFIDRDLHAAFYTLEFWGEQLSFDQSTCGAPVRAKGFLWGQIDCTYSIPEATCCAQGQHGVPSTMCPAIDINQCHFPG